MSRQNTFKRRMGEGGEYWQEEIEDILRNKIVSMDFAQFILGDCLGRGCSRAVFDYKPKPGYVVKIEMGEPNYNVIEAEVWREIGYVVKMAKWFAPVVEISKNGKILIQKKAKIDENALNYPDKIPAFLTDIKPGNYGFIGKQFVCVDYGIIKMLDLKYDYKLRKANWF